MAKINILDPGTTKHERIRLVPLLPRVSLQLKNSSSLPLAIEVVGRSVTISDAPQPTPIRMNPTVLADLRAHENGATSNGARQTTIAGKSERRAVFIDEANVAKGLGLLREKGFSLDYSKLLKWLTLGTILTGAYIYVGLDPRKPQIQGWYAKLHTLGYTVNVVEGKQYADGSTKEPNADLPMACDLLLKMEEYDTAVLVSGDGDFYPAVKALMERGKGVRIVAFRSQMAQVLRESGADVFFLEDIVKHCAMPRSVLSSVRGM
ncbi:MAG: NYN domain-containing protein [Chloroflexi bacterium]|nr:NYN domain-containing protein [Chloroflexota bacterium]